LEMEPRREFVRDVFPNLGDVLRRKRMEAKPCSEVIEANTS
jgi:hypothetical protein